MEGQEVFQIQSKRLGGEPPTAAQIIETLSNSLDNAPSTLAMNDLPQKDIRQRAHIRERAASNEP